LDELLAELAQASPDHPLVALFQPLVEKNTDLLRQNAGEYYTQKESYPAVDSSKNKLKDVFLDWLMQRFTNLGKKEIEQMLLGKLPDLRETQAGKDLIAIGIEEGFGKGVETGELIGTLRTCLTLLSESQKCGTNRVLEFSGFARGIADDQTNEFIAGGWK